jgi:hypothetical protein
MRHELGLPCLSVFWSLLSEFTILPILLGSHADWLNCPISDLWFLYSCPLIADCVLLIAHRPGLNSSPGYLSLIVPDSLLLIARLDWFLAYRLGDTLSKGLQHWLAYPLLRKLNCLSNRCLGTAHIRFCYHSVFRQYWPSRCLANDHILHILYIYIYTSISSNIHQV